MVNSSCSPPAEASFPEWAARETHRYQSKASFRGKAMMTYRSFWVLALTGSLLTLSPARGEQVLRIVGSEEARSIALALTSVRRTNWTCSFPASSFHEDAIL